MDKRRQQIRALFHYRWHCAAPLGTSAPQAMLQRCGRWPQWTRESTQASAALKSFIPSAAEAAVRRECISSFLCLSVDTSDDSALGIAGDYLCDGLADNVLRRGLLTVRVMSWRRR